MFLGLFIISMFVGSFVLFLEIDDGISGKYLFLLILTVPSVVTVIQVLGPHNMAVFYRQVRKSLKLGKNN